MTPHAKNSSRSDFVIPLRSDEWIFSSTAGITPIWLDVYVSRHVRGQLRTLRCMRTDWGCKRVAFQPVDYQWATDVKPIDAYVLHGQRLHDASTFDEDDYRMTPEADLVLCENPESPLNFTELTISFNLYMPDVQSDSMTEDTLLRYLEYCLPW